MFEAIHLAPESMLITILLFCKLEPSLRILKAACRPRLQTRQLVMNSDRLERKNNTKAKTSRLLEPKVF